MIIKFENLDITCETFRQIFNMFISDLKLINDKFDVTEKEKPFEDNIKILYYLGFNEPMDKDQELQIFELLRVYETLFHEYDEGLLLSLQPYPYYFCIDI